MPPPCRGAALLFGLCLLAMFLINAVLLLSNHQQQKEESQQQKRLESENPSLSQKRDSYEKPPALVSQQDQHQQRSHASERTLPPSEYAHFVVPRPTAHRGLLNINKARVVLIDTDSGFGSTPIVVDPRKLSSDPGDSDRESIRFFVLGDFGAANREPQRDVAAAMSLVARTPWSKLKKAEHDEQQQEQQQPVAEQAQEEQQQQSDRVLLFDAQQVQQQEEQQEQEEQPGMKNHHHRNAEKWKNHRKPSAHDPLSSEQLKRQQQEEASDTERIDKCKQWMRHDFNRPGGASVDFIVSTGDQIYESGVENEYDSHWKHNFEDVYDNEKRVPGVARKILLGMHGNHALLSHGIARDASGEIRYTFANKMQRYWMPASFYHQEFVSAVNPAISMIVVVLNTYDYSGHMTRMRASQVKWLDDVLSKTRARWRVVAGHRPIYSAGKKHGSSKYMQSLLNPIFERHNVSLYLSGDDHQLQVLRPSAAVEDKKARTTYVVSGAGARLEPIKKGGIPGVTLFQSPSDHGFAAVEVFRDELKLRMIGRHGSVLFETSIV